MASGWVWSITNCCCKPSGIFISENTRPIDLWKINRPHRCFGNILFGTVMRFYVPEEVCKKADKRFRLAAFLNLRCYKSESVPVEGSQGRMLRMKICISLLPC